MRKLVFIVLLFYADLSFAERFKVVFLNPGYPTENATGNFWLHVTQFMEAAAEDLDIELITLYSHRNHILMKSLINDVLREKPKYVILVNEKGIALTLIKQLAQYNVTSFMLLNNISEQDAFLLSAQQKKTLIGSVIPNNFSVGKKLLRGLVSIYKQREGISRQHANSFLSLKVLALQGDYTTPASLERERGLLEEIQSNKHLMLIDNTVANWSKQQAYEKVKGILQHTDVDIIWSANDAMAFGAKKAIVELNLTHKIVVGGINWDIANEGLSIDLSYGGHVSLGAKALIMLNDIDNKHLALNKRHQVIDIFESSLTPEYLLFSKLLNSQKIKSYNFSLFSDNQAEQLVFNINNLVRSFNNQ